MDQSIQSKILRYSALGILVIAVAVFIHIYLLKEEDLLIPVIRPFAKIEIDSDFLNSEEIQKLVPFDKISFPEEVGRSNPFEEY